MTKYPAAQDPKVVNAATGKTWNAADFAVPTALVETPLPELADTVTSVRRSWATTRALHRIEFRKLQLRALARMLSENEDVLAAALVRDLHKARLQGIMTEIANLQNDVAEAVHNMDAWAQPDAPRRGLVNLADSVMVRKEPLGVVLVMGAWNYPLLLTLAPVVAAIAAGNAVIIKPSEISIHTAQLIADLVPRYLDQRFFRVVNGGVQVATELLKQHYDHIFYTGNGAVGRIVMRAAAAHLTPVTLELGGKSPVIVHPSADLRVAARRIAFGKYMNAGQTCVAPDYVLVSREQQEPLLRELQIAIGEFYGADPKASRDYGRIVNERHFDRLAAYLPSFGPGNTTHGRMVVGDPAAWDRATKYIPPTVVADVGRDAPIMQDEIFGPILPIIPIDVAAAPAGTEDESGVPGGDAFMRAAAAVINRRDHPLAMYIFSRAPAADQWLLAHTQSGGVVVNDTMMQIITSGLPFGGVGPSGMGMYHGKYGFDTFSHHRATLIKPMGMEAINTVRYSPVGEKYIGLAKWFTFSKI
ncbi:Aldehyde/histidinol dehydrogenase [Blastocladiella britannica]|nr:Aldehyde/histidinol dehydrogenase [Blastocladiella britannica]